MQFSYYTKLAIHSLTEFPDIFVKKRVELNVYKTSVFQIEKCQNTMESVIL